jgi:hypothetical protein
MSVFFSIFAAEEMIPGWHGEFISVFYSEGQT